MKAVEVTFAPLVTLTLQPDGSYVAEVDWLSSVVLASVDGQIVADCEPGHPACEICAASEALDALIKKSPNMRGFKVSGNHPVSESSDTSNREEDPS